VQAPDLALRVSRYGWKLACPSRWAYPVCAALRFRWLGAVAPVALTIPIGPEPFKPVKRSIRTVSCHYVVMEEMWRIH